MQRRLLLSVILCTLVCFGMLGLAVGLGWSPRLGLDLEGGLSVVYKPAKPVTQTTLTTVTNIMSDRVNAQGVAQPNITTQGNDVVVQLPGVKNQKQILATLGTTAQLFFRPVLAGAPAYSGKKSAAYKVPPNPSSDYQYSSAYYSSSTGDYEPTNAIDPTYANYRTTAPYQDNADEHKNVILSSGEGLAPRYVLGPAEATGTIIKSATAELDPSSGGWVVNITFTSKGAGIWNTMATKSYHELLANDLDGVIESAPVIVSTSFPNGAEISGNFTEKSATTLALDLQYGALPVRLIQQDVQTVSPTLGKASLVAGLAAGLLGLFLVMCYTIFYYRALGIVVVLGLVTTAAFLYGFISLLGASSLGLTLDLSGVTGLIVSVGITVDSYVVYFERLKDEIRAGRSVRAAVDRGFRSAYRTILSADAVSFIGALVLWLLSVGAVRGFAFMLGLSTLVDVATAYVFTRPLVILLGRNRTFTEARHLGVARGLAQVRLST